MLTGWNQRVHPCSFEKIIGVYQVEHVNCKTSTLTQYIFRLNNLASVIVNGQSGTLEKRSVCLEGCCSSAYDVHSIEQQA